MSDWDDAVSEVNEAVNFHWGKPFTYISADGDEYQVEGVLDEHATTDDSATPGRYVRFLMSINELPFSPRSGDQIVLGAASYDITEVTEDQYESYVLMLRKVGG